MLLPNLDRHIIFEDAWIIVLDKPAGIVVNRSHTQKEPTIQDWMEKKIDKVEEESQKGETEETNTFEYGTPQEIFAARTGIVHRLDKDTSGVLLLAKTPGVLADLMRQFRDHATEKTYTALVHGKLVPSEGIVRLPMDRSSTDKLKFAVTPEGRMSETQYKVLEYYPGLPAGMHQKKGKSYQGFTLVELTPRTGRTHQIRVHMSAIKHPLVGDAVYAGRKRAVLDKEWCPRQFLHAAKLCFTHPQSGERMCFESPISDDLAQVLNLLETNH